MTKQNNDRTKLSAAYGLSSKYYMYKQKLLTFNVLERSVSLVTIWSNCDFIVNLPSYPRKKPPPRASFKMYISICF